MLDALQQAGFAAERQPPQEQSSAGAIGTAIALYLAEKLAEPEIDRLVAVVRGWATSWLRPRLPNRVSAPSRAILIYGPRGEVLGRVEIDED